MGKNFSRSERIAQQIRRELAEIIRLELKDPRIGMMTITDVEVSHDMAYAKVFYTLMGEEDKTEETAKALARSAGFLRSQLAPRFKLYRIPELEFIYDSSIEAGTVLSELIDKAVASSTTDDEKE